MFSSNSEGSSRLPGPDSILESIATGKSEEDMVSRMSSQSPGDLSQWMQAHPLPPGPSIFAAQVAATCPETMLGGNAPGIPLFLAQARNNGSKFTQMPLIYDFDNDVMPMGDLDASLPATHSVWNGNGIGIGTTPPPTVTTATAHGAEMLPVSQHSIPRPSAGFLMAQQSMFGGDAYSEHHANRQHAPNACSHPSGQGYGVKQGKLLTHRS
ncbi:hypothetical protein E4U54_006767 [Claviceps lovelessii]|nr:hypothetical protein E4U54_006767 [Claviceps lovelessii]